jgi:metal-dependent amidase/aminoacylase/carboxypeptidase family protein
MFDAPVAASSLADRIDAAARDIEARVIAWRRDIHANPELGNREFRTARIVAEHLHRWPCAPTWTRCRWPRRWTCRSPRR